jgi:hypothetical protein
MMHGQKNIKKSIIFESPVLNFAQIGQELRKLRVEIDLSLEVKLRPDFRETHACSTSFCKAHLH